MADPRNFLLNTDYPMDQIVYLKEGSFVQGDTGSFTINIPHNLPFTPLPEMVWSHTADFAICQTGPDETYMDNQWTTMVGEYYQVLANDTNIIIQGNNNSGTTKTIYYRIWAFAPSTASLDSIVSSTIDTGDNFILNTDYNYMKLAYNGYLPISGTQSVFTHNLGYIPRVKVWAISGITDPLVYIQSISTDPTGSSGSSVGLYVTTTQIIMMNNGGYNGIEYRIYYDS